VLSTGNWGGPEHVKQRGIGLLPRNQRQEALSRAYVRAIAARAGAICGDMVQDFGTDMFLRGVEQSGQQYFDNGPQVDLQLKSTSRAEVREIEVLHDVEVRAYDWLRQDSVIQPRFLVLLVLPEDESQWLTQSIDEMILRRCAFWLSLRGAAPTGNESTIRITIPRTNVFSVSTVRGWMGEGEEESKS
jgi:hypothetical protein